MLLHDNYMLHDTNKLANFVECNKSLALVAYVKRSDNCNKNFSQPSDKGAGQQQIFPPGCNAVKEVSGIQPFSPSQIAEIGEMEISQIEASLSPVWW